MVALRSIRIPATTKDAVHSILFLILFKDREASGTRLGAAVFLECIYPSPYPIEGRFTDCEYLLRSCFFGVCFLLLSLCLAWEQPYLKCLQNNRVTLLCHYKSFLSDSLKVKIVSWMHPALLLSFCFLSAFVCSRRWIVSDVRAAGEDRLSESWCISLHGLPFDHINWLKISSPFDFKPHDQVISGLSLTLRVAAVVKMLSPSSGSADWLKWVQFSLHY